MLCVDPSPLLPSSDPRLVPFHMDGFQFAEMKEVKYDALIVIQVSLTLETEKQCNRHIVGQQVLPGMHDQLCGFRKVFNRKASTALTVCHRFVLYIIMQVGGTICKETVSIVNLSLSIHGYLHEQNVYLHLIPKHTRITPTIESPKLHFHLSQCSLTFCFHRPSTTSSPSAAPPTSSA